MTNLLRTLYLRALLRSAERDVTYHEHRARVEPQLAELARGRVAELRVQLIDAQKKPALLR